MALQKRHFQLDKDTCNEFPQIISDDFHSNIMGQKYLKVKLLAQYSRDSRSLTQS